MSKKTANVLEETIAKTEAERLPIEDMPLTTFREYKAYNEEARKLNKKLRICRYPIKQIPEELHPKQRVVVHNNQQPNNPVTVFLSNDLIHFDQKLIPGKEYDLPECVIHHLATLGNPVWQYFNLADGSRETRMAHKTPRFSIRTVFAG